MTEREVGVELRLEGGPIGGADPVVVGRLGERISVAVPAWVTEDGGGGAADESFLQAVARSRGEPPAEAFASISVADLLGGC